LETVGHYRILERLGESRLGEMFRARDTRLGRSVALTIPADDIQNDPPRRTQLLADAQRAMAVSHPNIAALYEVGDDAGRLYLAFEFVRDSRSYGDLLLGQFPAWWFESIMPVAFALIAYRFLLHALARKRGA